MKNVIFLLLILLFASSVFAQTADDPKNIQKIDPNPDKGFTYSYFLYVPNALREPDSIKKTQTILVIPNNTGKIDDSFEIHELDAKKRITQNAVFADTVNVAILMPAFPRPESDWQIYTHALDRDAMLTEKKEYSRFDLQLIAMIDDARQRLKSEKLKFDKKVLITGFSASGMFANRFVFLHPERVKAAAIGSPGGWAIAPAAAYKEKPLRYPIGTGDIETVSGVKFSLKDLRKVPLFIFLGAEDDNDSVIFGDSYEEEDKNLIFELFGKTPVERWDVSKQLYKDAGLAAEFKLYPNVKHAINLEMRDDILSFFRKYIE